MKVNKNKGKIKDNFKKTIFYENIHNTIDDKKIFFFQKLLNIIRFQKNLILRNKLRTLIIMIFIFLISFLSLFISVYPTLLNSFYRSLTTKITPFNSSTDYTMRSNNGNKEKYIRTTSDNSVYNPELVRFNSVVDSFPNEPYILNNLNYSSSIVPSYPTFNYDNYNSSTGFINMHKILAIKSSEQNEPNKKINVFTSQNVLQNAKNLASIMVSFFSVILDFYDDIIDDSDGLGEGLGGLIWNSYNINDFSYLDGFSYYIANHDYSNFTDAEKIELKIPLLLSQLISRAVATVVLKSPVGSNDAAKARFSKFLSSDMNNPNLGFSSLLIVILSFFAPNFISKNISGTRNIIAKKYTDTKKDLNVFYENPFNDYFLSFGDLPWDPQKDELYTWMKGDVQLSDNKTINQEIIGYNKDSKFWKIQGDKNKLITNDAYQNFQNGMTGLPDGSYNRPIPVEVSEKYAKINNVTNGDIFQMNFYRNYRFSNHDIDNEKKYFTVVNVFYANEISKIITSREEMNSIIFRNTTEPWIYESNTDKNKSKWYTYKNIYNNKQNRTCDGYNDGKGYFNGIFYKDIDSPFLKGFIICTNGKGYSLQSNFNFFYGANFIDGSELYNVADNVYRVLLIIGLILIIFFIFILFLILIMFSRVLINSNKRNFISLKVLGFTSNSIMVRSFIFYLFFAFFVSCFFILPFYKFFANFWKNVLIDDFLGYNYSFNFHYSWYFFGIYFSFIFLFYLVFYFFSIKIISQLNINSLKEY